MSAATLHRESGNALNAAAPSPFRCRHSSGITAVQCQTEVQAMLQHVSVFVYGTRCPMLPVEAYHAFCML